MATIKRCDLCGNAADLREEAPGWTELTLESPTVTHFALDLCKYCSRRVTPGELSRMVGGIDARKPEPLIPATGDI